MHWQASFLLALLAYSPSVRAARPQYPRRQDQPSGYNVTIKPQQLPSASSTAHNTTSVTVTYDFVAEDSTPTASTPTISVISTYVVVSTYTKSSPIEEAGPSDTASSTAPAVASSTASRRPYPISGGPSQSYVVPGNASLPTAPSSSALLPTEQANASRRPKAYRPKPDNETCGGATLNVVQAHLDYWYTETYTHTVSTLSVQFNANDSQTGWTLLPATTGFDIATAITQHTCGPSTTLDYRYNRTSTDWDCFTTPTPTASSTSVLSVDAVKNTNQTTGNGTVVPNIATKPPLAVATLPSDAGTYTEGTNFVYFSEYAIESSKPTTFRNGTEGCAVETRMFMLNRLFSFAFDDEDGEISAQRLAGEDTTGSIDPEFLRLVGETESVTAGSWTAEPTVLVVVERRAVAQAVLAGYTEVPGGPLITPEPTLPPFLTPKAPTTPTANVPTYYSPRVEQTADSLDVPTVFKPFNVGRLKTFVAHVENSATTLILPEPTDAEVITTKVNGQVVTATALSNVLANGDEDGNGDTGSDNGSNGGTGSNGGSNGNSGSNGNNGGNSNTGSNSNTGGSSGNGNGNGNSNGEAMGSKDDGQNGSGGSNAPNNNGDDEDDWVMGPFVAQIMNSAVTLDVPAPSTAEVITAAFEGKTLTATALRVVETAGQNGGGSNGGSGNGGSSNGGSNNGGSNNGGSGNGGSNNGGSSNGGSGNNVGGSQNGGNAGGNNGNGGKSDGNADGVGYGHMVSVIVDSAKPSNAAQVLSQAMAQGHSDKTAAAIVAGLGGIAAGVAANEGGYGSNGQGNSGSGSGSGSGGQAGGSGASPGQVITVDGATITASPAQAFVVDGKTVIPGGAPITVDGTVISIPASTNAVVVDGSTVPLAGDFASSTAFNVNGMMITAASGVGFPIAGQTLQAGGPAITVDGTRLSLAPGGTALVIGSSTSAIAAERAGAASNIPELTIGSQTFTANAATQFFLASGQTLTPGGTAVISGTTVSLDASASAIVINGETSTFGSAPDATITSPPDIINVNGQAYAPNAGGSYLISGQTLTPGGSITITGANGAETLSLSPSGSELIAVVSGHTITNTLDGSAADATAAPVLTIGGQTFTALPGSDGAEPTYLINGKLFTAGEEETVTVGGRTYVVSLAPEATLLEIEELGSDGRPTATRLQTLFPATMTGRTSTMIGTESESGTGTGSGSGSGNGDGDATETGAAPAAETGAATSLTGSVQVTSFFIGAGTLALAFLL